MFNSAYTALRALQCNKERLLSNPFWKRSTTNTIGALFQIRTATKRSTGSTTNNKDSAGRRLGIKKHEGMLVKTGQILYRQRGTKICPGENTAIGRDHTIYAMEPGYVRYYLDPFHPKRKFVGVALLKDMKLPSDHWAPRVRRFGYVEITDPKEALKEEQHLGRKEWLLKQKLDEDIAKRQSVQNKVQEQYLSSFEALGLGFSAEEAQVAAKRVVLLKRFVRGGCSLEQAEKNASFTELYDMKLAFKRGELDEAAYTAKTSQYNSISNKLKQTEFNTKFELVKRLSLEEKKSAKSVLHEELLQYSGGVYTKDIKTVVSEKIEEAEKSGILSRSDVVRFRRKFLKPVLGESVGVVEKPGKGVLSYKKYDYDSGKVVEVYREKGSFLSQVK